MKYVIFIPDGSSDYPVDELDGKTPLMVANTPNIDKLACKGFGGFTNNVPDQYTPGSDVANLNRERATSQKSFLMDILRALMLQT